MIDQNSQVAIPSEKPIWYWWWYLASLLPVPLALFAEGAWLLGWRGTLERLAFIAPPGHLFGVVYFWSFGIAIPLIVILITLNLRKQLVVVDSSGIRGRSLLSRRQARWDELRYISPVGHDVVFVDYFPKAALFYRRIWLTRNQATVVLTHPKMPVDLVSPEVLKWVRSVHIAMSPEPAG